MANYGIVRKPLNHHSGHLMLVQLSSNARKVAPANRLDIVVQKDDLSPTVKSGQQEAEVALRAQITLTISIRLFEGYVRCSLGQLSEAPCVWHLDD
jgi:hypothetical protein